MNWFLHRQDAGKKLAKKLLSYKNKKNTTVLGIPRGGVIVAAEVAKILKLPLDVVIIKKLAYPGQEELALGAVGLKEVYLNKEIAEGVDKEYIHQEIAAKQQQAKKRYEFLRGTKKPLLVKNKTIILIDDGMATGATMFLAIEILKKQGAKKIVVAVPIAPPETIKKLKKAIDEVVCLEQPEFFGAIGAFYRDFEQVEEEECKRVMGKNDV